MGEPSGMWDGRPVAARRYRQALLGRRRASAVLRPLVVLATVIIILLATGSTAAAGGKTVSVIVRWSNVPRGTAVRFNDLGGNCDRNKKAPSIVKHADNGSTLFTLFTTTNTGSCAFEGSNGQYKITVTLPTRAQGWTNVNISQPGAGESYNATCYGQDGLTCRNGGESKNDSAAVNVTLSLGPVTRGR